ncbi:MAG: CBS domain-containing protein [Nanoarchaeota archaeon]|nr:CBS domain-containing protein [Nanoarchaeota archaeon]
MELVKDIMTKKVITSIESDSLMSIGKKMAKYGISCVVIVKDKKPIGIITERDLSQKVVAKNMDCKKTGAKRVMSKPIQTIKPETNIYFTNQLMKKKKFRRFPVAKDGKLVGIITQSDLIKYFADQRKKFVIESLKRNIKGSYPI